MKKIVLFLIGLLFLVLLMIYFHHQKDYQEKYTVSSYSVLEERHKIENHYDYNFVIQKDKEKYSFSFSSSKKEKKNIIQKVKSYQEDKLLCIVPILRLKKTSLILCSDGVMQYSKEILKDNESFSKILEEAKITEPVEIPSKEYDKIMVYDDNIEEDEVFYIWNYKGIYVVRKNKTHYKQFLENDLYDNVMATTTTRYYVLFDNTSVDGIQKIYYYDLKKDKVSSFTPNIILSKDSYINGVVGEMIYITDRKKKLQYALNMKKKEINAIGNDNNSYLIIQNNEKKFFTKSDFFMKTQLFENERNTYSDITDSNDCVLYNGIYYYLEGNTFYKNKEGKVALFSLDDVIEWNVVKDGILLLKDDSLYLYDDLNGLRRILDYPELRYNYLNIYKIGR
ncbi:MAG: hypothetical protein IJG68_06035 [Bacilli bacterium]|nr:hypothetical protein [Bacilli bacterium]